MRLFVGHGPKLGTGKLSCCKYNAAKVAAVIRRVCCRVYSDAAAVAGGA
jgi:hypothetical protein